MSVGEVVGGVSWHCQLASQLAVSIVGVSWRYQLAVLIGSVNRRCQLVVSVSGVNWRCKLASHLASQLAVSVGESVGVVSWQCQLAESVGDVYV